MRERIYINGKDAYKEWGLSLESDGLNALLAPIPMKPFIENKSTQEHGKAIYPVNPRIDERDVQIAINILASSNAQFIERYHSFMIELQKGIFRIHIVYAGIDETFNMVYLSCQQFSQFNMRCAKFLLRLNEPNPANRNTDSYADDI